MTYITKTQYNNTVKMTLGAILATKEGAAMSDRAIADAVGTSPSSVRRCRKTLRDCGLLGQSAAGSAFKLPRVPVATWVDFYKRVEVLHEWIVVAESFKLLDVPHAIRYEVSDLQELLNTDGSLEGVGSELFKSRLEGIEAWSETAQSQCPPANTLLC